MNCFSAFIWIRFSESHPMWIFVTIYSLHNPFASCLCWRSSWTWIKLLSFFIAQEQLLNHWEKRLPRDPKDSALVTLHSVVVAEFSLEIKFVPECSIYHLPSSLLQSWEKTLFPCYSNEVIRVQKLVNHPRSRRNMRAGTPGHVCVPQEPACSRSSAHAVHALN